MAGRGGQFGRAEEPGEGRGRRGLPWRVSASRNYGDCFMKIRMVTVLISFISLVNLSDAMIDRVHGGCKRRL